MGNTTKKTTKKAKPATYTGDEIDQVEKELESTVENIKKTKRRKRAKVTPSLALSGIWCVIINTIKMFAFLSICYTSWRVLAADNDPFPKYLVIPQLLWAGGMLAKHFVVDSLRKLMEKE